MDLNDVEGIDFNALGGADTIVVNDLSGTDVTEVNIDLAAVGGAGDGQPDNVIVHGTNGDDVVLVVGDATGVSVLGLAAQVNITGAEAANDRLTVNALAGDDVVEASGLAAGAIQLTADGGDGRRRPRRRRRQRRAARRRRRRRADRRPRHRRPRRRRRRRRRDPARRRRRRDLGDRRRQGVAGDPRRIVDGKTVLDVGGKQRTLPQTDLSQLVQDARS